MYNVHTHTRTYTLYCNPGAAYPLQVYEFETRMYMYM